MIGKYFTRHTHPYGLEFKILTQIGLFEDETWANFKGGEIQIGTWKARIIEARTSQNVRKVELGFCFMAKEVGIKRHEKTKGAESNLADNVMV